MKTIYFVRHGESENNAVRRFNSIDTPLSEIGMGQAETIAKRLARLPIKAIVSSDMLRAQQTSLIISSRIGIPVETSSYFRERVSATSILGKKRDDPSTVAAMKKIQDHFHDSGWRYEDGENFEDLKKRAIEGLEYLEKRNEDAMAVVSHGIFMYIIAATVMFGSSLTSRECMHIMESLGKLENTALTVVKRRSSKVEGSQSPWRLMVWNDHAHLG
ncbi:MAG: histidine phosphatase family protein [bacterium]|nr:histidine phosphatase family protein [bacterium]